MTEIIVTESLSGAVFTDTKGDTVTLSGTWTTYYDSVTGAVENGVHADHAKDTLLNLTATGSNGKTTHFTSGYAPYTGPLEDAHGKPDGYEITNNAADNGNFSSLYFDYTTEHPNALATTLSCGRYSSIRDASGNLYTLTNPGHVTSGPCAPPCFLRGTRIATAKGEVAVEDLVIGEEVTLHTGGTMPVKWIGRRAYQAPFAANNPDIMPIRIAAGALADGIPTRDLLVSPNHAMFIGGVLIHAGDLVNGVSVAQISMDLVEYFHVELDRHAIILAEAAATESYTEFNNRHQFHNAAEYFARNPGIGNPAVFCAPLIQDGPVLEAARLALASRAGLAAPNPALVTGDLLGNLDHADDGIAEGWAMDADHHDVPLHLEIYRDGTLIAATTADRYRPDLADAGISQGRNGFRVTLPSGSTGTLKIRRTTDGAILNTERKAA